MRIADEARQTGDLSRAINALETLLARFPADPRTPASRFQLARLYLSTGRFEQARATLALCARESGPLSEDAYLRWVELEQKHGAPAQAKQLATEYLDRYPQGRHRLFMQSLQKR